MGLITLWGILLYVPKYFMNKKIGIKENIGTGNNSQVPHKWKLEKKNQLFGLFNDFCKE